MTDTAEAALFLDQLDLGGSFTFLTFDDSPAKRKEVVRVLHGTLSQHAAMLGRLNDAGAGVFVTVNQTDLRGRDAGNVTAVRALFIDLDGAPLEPVLAGPLLPHIAVESSPGRWHAYWLIADCPLGAFRALQRGLLRKFGGDRAVIDLPRVMRLPGYQHRKGEPFQSRICHRYDQAHYTLREVLDAFGWRDLDDAAPKVASAVRSALPLSAAPEADIQDDLRSALRHLSAEAYDDWVRVGYMLHGLGWHGRNLWLEWSATSAKFDEADAVKRWDTFKPSEAGYHGVFASAKLAGWDPRSAPSVLRKRAARRREDPPLYDSPPQVPEAVEASAEPASVPEAVSDNGSSAIVPPPLDTEPHALLERFELVHGSKRVWDCCLSVDMPWGAFVALVGKAPAAAWIDDSKRRARLMPSGSSKPGKDKKKRGAGGSDGWSGKLEWMLPRYALIYGEEAVFDRERRKELTLAALRAYVGLRAVRDWGDHPKREVIDPEQVIFDPRRELDDPRVCNLWGGWPTEPKEGTSEDGELVLRWLAVLYYAVGESDHILDWVLKWIAYPLQHPGAKMRTSIVMHGPEGSGKNTVWDAVRRIYARYGIQITQTQLEQQWTDWLSAKLFVVGNEVLHRQEQVTQKGRLKSLITDDTLRVERKFMAGRDEINFANLVFLSNELVPLSLDPGDRRFLVVWTPPPHPEGRAFYEGLGADRMPDSTVQALYQYFLQIDLGDFDAHTKPPMTQAKAELIDASLESHQRFVLLWLAGDLPIECRPCKTQQLYKAYLWWCRENGERFPKPENRFAARAKKEMRHGIKRYLTTTQATKQATFYLPGDPAPPDKAESTWLGGHVEFFRNQYEQWKNEE